MKTENEFGFRKYLTSAPGDCFLSNKELQLSIYDRT